MLSSFADALTHQRPSSPFVTLTALRTLIGVQRHRLLLIVALLAACGSLAWAAGQTRPRGASVAIEGTSFVPPELTVTVGQAVTWTNKDPFPHNVSSSAGKFSSKNLEAGGVWTFTPRTAGRFPYVCTLHPGMKGTLVVKKEK